MKKSFSTFLGVLFLAFINCLSVYSQEEKWTAQMKLRLERMADSLTVNLMPWKVPERIFMLRIMAPVEMARQ